MTAPSPDDLPGLVEAVAEAMWSSAIEHDADSDATPWERAQPWDREWTHMQARAAVAAMVEHLGLTEETRLVPASIWTPGSEVIARRFVTPWREVDRGDV